MITMLVVLVVLVVALVAAGALIIGVMVLWAHLRRCTARDPDATTHRCAMNRGHIGYHAYLSKDAQGGVRAWKPDTAAA